MNLDVTGMIAADQLRDKHDRAATARRAAAARYGLRKRPRLRLRAMLAQRVRRSAPAQPAQPCAEGPL